MNFYSCLDLPRAEARIHEKKSNYLKAILENHQNRSTINRRRAADLPYSSFQNIELPDLALNPCWLRQSHLTESLLWLRAIPHHSMKRVKICTARAQCRQHVVSRHVPGSSTRVSCTVVRKVRGGVTLAVGGRIASPELSCLLFLALFATFMRSQLVISSSQPSLKPWN